MYLPARFPLNIGREPAGGPEFKTRMAETISGNEQRNQDWSRSKHRYDVSHSINSEAEFQTVGAHFRMARGKLHTFRFRDWGDYRCTRTDGLLVPLTATTYQLHKVYGTEVGFQEQRKITRPYSGSVQVWKDGGLQATPANYTINHETGVVTFATAPSPAVLEAAFSFDVPCRYDTDQLKATLIQYNAAAGSSFLSWDSVPTAEVRE